MTSRRDAVELLRAALQPDPERTNVFEACLALARGDAPDLAVEPYRARMAEWVARIQQEVAAVNGPQNTANKLAAVCHVLFGQLGLRGNSEDYDDPLNSLIHEVMDRHLGLPITMAILMVEVASRVGLRASGIAFPGHFLVRVEDEEPGSFVVVDAFGGGRILGEYDIHALLAGLTGRSMPIHPDMLKPASATQTLVRVLRNLRSAYLHRENLQGALRAQERLLLLTPDDDQEIRDHGVMLAQAGEPGAATAELERYLQRNAQASDAEQVQRILSLLKRHAYDVV